MAVGKTQIADLDDLFADIFEQAMRIARAQSPVTQLVTTYTNSIGTEDRVFSERRKAHAVKLGEGDTFASPAKLGKDEIARLTPGEAMAGATISHRAIRQDPEARTEAAYELGSALAKLIESDLISVFPSLNGGEGATIGAAGATLTWGHMLAGQVQLAASNIAGPYNAVLHPYQAFDLAKQVSLEKDQASLPDAVKNGLAADMFIGRYQQMNFYTSNDIAVDVSDDAIGGLFVPEAIALDVREAPHMFTPEFDQDAREWKLRMYTDYAFGARRANYGVSVTSDAAAPTS